MKSNLENRPLIGLDDTVEETAYKMDRHFEQMRQELRQKIVIEEYNAIHSTNRCDRRIAIVLVQRFKEILGE